jgi:cold shock CspA family protein
MTIGLIERFISDRGFGFIATSSGREYFLHITNYKSKNEVIYPGMAVIFEESYNSVKMGYEAINCRYVDKGPHWRYVIQLMEGQEKIWIKNRGTGKLVGYDVIEICARQIFKGRDTEGTKTIIQEGFEKHLRPRDFIRYCETLVEVVPGCFKAAEARGVLAEIFSFLGTKMNPDILFYVWKERKFRFIGRDGVGDFEIPETVLSAFADHLEFAELKRIREYSFGAGFVSGYIWKKIESIDDLSFDEMASFSKQLELLDSDEAMRARVILKEIAVRTFRKLILESSTEWGNINNEAQFRLYAGLKAKIPGQVDQRIRDEIIGEINSLIVTHCGPEYRIDLWLKGLISEISKEEIRSRFLDGSASASFLTGVLGKLNLEEQLELVVQYGRRYGCLLVLNLIQVVTEKELLEAYKGYLEIHAGPEERFELFIQGFINELQDEVALDKAKQCTESEFTYMVKKLAGNARLLYELLVAKIDVRKGAENGWLCNLANSLLTDNEKTSFHLTLFSVLAPADYFNLWEEGRVSLFPVDYIKGVLLDQEVVYKRIDYWLTNLLVSREELGKLLFNFLKECQEINSQPVVYRCYFHIKYLLRLDENWRTDIREIGDLICDLLLWYLDGRGQFDFSVLAQKFVYFRPDDQAAILRKLFFLKETGEINFSIGDLDSFIRIDSDLFNILASDDPDLPVDISVDIILEALKSFGVRRKFLVEAELLQIAYGKVGGSRSKRFTIFSFFDPCRGRTKVDYNWDTVGSVSRQPFETKTGVSSFYFAIYLSPHRFVRVRGYDGSWEYREVFNEDFSRLKAEIKKLPHAKWNPDCEHWGVPRQYEKEVIGFAVVNRFLLELGGDKNKDNRHLLSYSEGPRPEGINFCEGRPANKEHDNFGVRFWWCAGRPCFRHCGRTRLPSDWQEYTLLDFCRILGFDVSETTRTGDFLAEGAYYRFVSLINRFRELLERLYCHNCGEVLYPVETGNFAAHNVVRFSCSKLDCKEHGKEVYLNHCLNGKCNWIIDSRVSKACPNGLFICDHCGCCCSHGMMERRLANLEMTGGYIPQRLLEDIANKRGHLEKREHFCYKCGGQMKETKPEVFECTCGVRYDHRQYGFKRPPWQDMRSGAEA